MRNLIKRKKVYRHFQSTIPIYDQRQINKTKFAIQKYGDGLVHQISQSKINENYEQKFAYKSK